MSDTTAQAVQACHELIQWLIPQLDKLPRLRRFTLGERLEQALLDVLELLLEAAYTRSKQPALQRANLRLELARHLWRLAHELEAVSTRRNAYALKMDVAQYFPSIDHAILKSKLRRRIKDARVLELLDRIIDTSPEIAQAPVYYPGDDLLSPLERRRGIPIGNLTSQFLANLYLDDLDHFVKQQLKLEAYLRYVDDMVVLDDDKGRLTEVRAAVGERLAADRLLLHPRKAHVSPTADGLNLLGYLVFPNHRCLRNDNGHRFSRRMRAFARAYAQGLITFDDIEPSIQSWIGHAMHADTERLRAKIISAIVFRRGTGREAAGVWCAGAPGTTNRRTSARPTATGPPPTTGTTTSVFVSPSPPARPNGRARSRSV